MTTSFQVNPQPETYWGHVNPIGPRACYDEAKRIAETLCYAYQKQVSIGDVPYRQSLCDMKKQCAWFFRDFIHIRSS